MRLSTLPLFLIATMTASGSASAFNCAAAKLPWDIVVCSDVQLQRLADERLAAFEEAKARLTEKEVQHLRDDQASWVHSYSASCGIRPDRAPPLPVPAEAIECFRRAGEARLAYLRAYGAASPKQTEVAGTPLPANASSAESASAAVSMETSGGIYMIPVRINQALTLRFIIDSGATDVSIPADVALTLVRTGTIADGDFIGDQRYRLGDGSTVKSARFVLRDLEVGGQVLRNVIASVGAVESVPLLGQSFLSNFTSWTLDNDRHVLLLGRQRSGVATPANPPAAQPQAQGHDATAQASTKLPELPPSKRWVVIASRDDLKEAISIAQEYKSNFSETFVAKSENGNYGVTIGQFDVIQNPSLLAQMVEEKRIPKDSYLTLGKRFLSIVWK